MEQKGELISYRPDIKVVDCTIRDGGLVNNFYFDDEFVRNLYTANVAAGVEYMEFGYKASKEIFDVKEFGKWKFCDEQDIRDIVGDNNTDLKISVMADVGRTDYKKDIIPKTDSEVFKIKLDNVIGKLADHIRENRPICLSLPFNEKKYVHPTDIIYILSKSNYLDIICQQETIHIRGKIESILELLSPKYFARIHNRCIVNLKHLCRIDNTHFKALIDNGIELDISRTYKAVLIEKYNVYLRDFT